MAYQVARVGTTDFLNTLLLFSDCVSEEIGLSVYNLIMYTLKSPFKCNPVIVGALSERLRVLPKTKNV